jgi:hypothetical protein
VCRALCVLCMCVLLVLRSTLGAAPQAGTSDGFVSLVNSSDGGVRRCCSPAAEHTLCRIQLRSHRPRVCSLLSMRAAWSTRHACVSLLLAARVLPCTRPVGYHCVADPPAPACRNQH